VIAGAALVTVALVMAAVAVAGRGRRPVEWRPTLLEPPHTYDEIVSFAVFSPDGKWLAFTSDREERYHAQRVYVEPLDSPASVGMHPARALGPPAQEIASLHWAVDGKSVLYVESSSSDVIQVSLDGGAPRRILDAASMIDDCGRGRLLVVRNAPGCPTCDSVSLRDEDGTERELERTRPGERALRGVICDRMGQQALMSIWREAPAPTLEVWTLPLNGGPHRVVSTGALPTFYGLPFLDRAAASLLEVRHERTGDAELFEASLKGAQRRRLASFSSLVGVLDVSPDDGTLLLQNWSNSSAISAIAVDRGAARRLALADLFMGAPLVTPDGRVLVAQRRSFRRFASQTVAYRLDTGEERILGKECLRMALTLDGREVVCIQWDKPQFHVVALPLTGGAPRRLADVVDDVDAVVQGRMEVGADGQVHLSLALRRGEATSACVIPLAGGEPRVEAPLPWRAVVPLYGGWRLAVRLAAEGTASENRLIPPGHALEDPAARVLPVATYALTTDRRAVLYARGTRIYRFDLARGEEQLLVDRPGGSPDAPGYALAPDGKTLYVSESIRTAQLRLITNFADRPRLR
jgi:hypothetical protein